MKAQVQAKVQVTFPLSFRQFVRLKSSSTMHYDYHCRSMSMIGGFLYGWSNEFQFLTDAGAITNSDATIDVTVDWNQLDIAFCVYARDYQPEFYTVDHRLDGLVNMFLRKHGDA